MLRGVVAAGQTEEVRPPGEFAGAPSFTCGCNLTVAKLAVPGCWRLAVGYFPASLTSGFGRRNLGAKQRPARNPARRTAREAERQPSLPAPTRNGGLQRSALLRL